MKIRIICSLLLACALNVNAQKEVRLTAAQTPSAWVGTWATAQQIPVKSYMPFNNCMTFRSVRQIVKVSTGGNIVRLQISNELSNEPLIIKSVYIANAKDSSAIDVKSAAYLQFDGRHSVTIEPGKAVFSDARKFELKELQKLAITINYKTAPKEPTVHMGSRTTTYILKGYSGPLNDFTRAFREDHWFNIAAIDVYNTNVESIAIIGNSITDGKNSTTNQQDRWPDVMAEYLNIPSEDHSTKGKGVLNLGIGGNRVLTTGLGAPAKDRFDHDILEQRGVKDVILFEGINDLGTSRDGLATARMLIEQYRIMINKAHAHHLRIFGATITPMKGAGYYSANHEAGRLMVNEWIRTSKEFDGVIDFDELMRDPADHSSMRREWQSDWLHPNAIGYREMGRFAAEKMKNF